MDADADSVCSGNAFLQQVATYMQSESYPVSSLASLLTRALTYSSLGIQFCLAGRHYI